MFTLPEGDYRFRADLNGTRFWSADENHCTLPGCESVDVSVAVPLTVSVVDTDGTPQSGIAVYAFNGDTYMNFSKTTNEYGQAVFTMPEGDYRFRADAGGTHYWSSESNDCTLPGCTAVTVSTSKPISVTVVDSLGTPQVGLNVYAYDDTTYTGFSKVSDEYGNAVFYLPAGDYRFRADSGGTQFWSAETNTCTLSGCESIIISVTQPVTVTVVDTDGTAQAGLNVYAFDGETYSNYSKVTDEYGQAIFSLPAGDYHFRADVSPISEAGGGTQFWSAEENSCALPGCVTDSVTVTKPVTVSVKGEEGNPYADLNVYAFNGETYAGYSGKTDAGGQVTFTLPEGSYHFRADFDGVQFWSNNENSCTIPGCEEDSVILPGGTGEQDVSIDYTYDALNRLISAEYSNGTAFGYTYDAAGNVLTYAETHYGQTTVTNYTYDAANQLLTAVEDETVWQYSYDGNGSLIQTNPGTEVGNGSTRYTYNTAGYLTNVENYTLTGTGTTEWQTQSELTYDGLGNRLEVITYSDGEGNTTRYVLDGVATLTEIGTESSTHYLYGRGVIGTLGESWSYILSDGAGSTRQLVDEEGAVNLSVSYTPWGDTMEIYGSGMLNLGYMGGVYDAGTGLIYMGNGQYYDPGTGRFLTRGAQQDQSNPYTPSNSDPSGMLIAPLALLALVFGRKKNRKRRDDILITILLILTIATSFTMIGESLVQPVVANSVNYDQNNLPVIPSQAYVANNIDSYSEENYLPPVPWDPPTPLPEPDDCTDEDRRAFFKKLVTDSGFALVTQYGSMISPFVRDVFYEFGFIQTEEGYYYTRQDCRQQWGGFNHGYDDIFNYFTDMRTDQFDFTYHGVKLRFWAWKGYYLNLGAGAEMGIYRSWDIAGIPTGHWYVDQTYALRMELRLQHKNGEIIYNYKPREHQWWIAAFHPFYQDVMASDLHARFIVYFDGKTDMYNAFANSIDAPNDKRWVWFPNQNAAIFNFK